MILVELFWYFWNQIRNCDWHHLGHFIARPLGYFITCITLMRHESFHVPQLLGDPRPPFHCVGCLEHLKPPSSSISPSSRHLFYFLWFRVVCKTIWGHHEMCLTFCLSPHTHTPVTHCRQVLCFYVFIFCLCFFYGRCQKWKQKQRAKPRAENRKPKVKSIMGHKCFDCINVILWCTLWRAACHVPRTLQDSAEFCTLYGMIPCSHCLRGLKAQCIRERLRVGLDRVFGCTVLHRWE